jgi:glycosyltransferase involved in cell wall biosynthesis
VLGIYVGGRCPSFRTETREQPMRLEECRTALVHHWFVGLAGAERVCEALCDVIKAPDLFALVANLSTMPLALRKLRLVTSFVQGLPRSTRWYRYYAPLFPLAVESFDLSAYDLVISSDANMVKGVITKPETCHICYCHSPMRYAWNLTHEHLGDPRSIRYWIKALGLHYLRLWDYSASSRVDYFVANSMTVRSRIWKYYRRDASVIYPPCDIDFFARESKIDDFYLFVGRLVSYKRADVAINAFSQSGRRLIVVGEGPEENRLKSRAAKNVELLGRISDDQLAELYASCKALIFPGEEDFGLVPVEAQACGRPVIAFRRGGALESVVEGETGLFFNHQTPEELNTVVADFERHMDRFRPEAARRNAERFSKERFQREMAVFIQRSLNDHQSSGGNLEVCAPEENASL